MKEKQYPIGMYRPIYLWGGPGTIRMNRVKFMDQPVNELAHQEVHTVSGAAKVVKDLYSNWIHLMFDWGFPPEIEQEDWEDFKTACAIYHELGAKVFAYIQTSNCVYQGSFRDKDWYAVDAKGRKVYYYTQRYMVNLLHPEWQAHICELITRAIDYGADGIFFDNLWDGAMPVSMAGTWLGNAGSYDPITTEAYRGEIGGTIPTDFSQDTPEVRAYLRWRMQKVTTVVGRFAEHARALKPDVVIGANDFDMVMRNSPLIYGLNLEQQAQVQDITMIENYAIPKWTPEKKLLVNNAQTIRVARELVGNKAHLSVLSYDAGIGFDGMYHPVRFRQTIAEAAACGVTNTIKGTEYFHQGQHTMLTAEGFEVQRGAVGYYLRWLEGHASLLEGQRENLADVVLVYPEEEMAFRWHTVAPLFFAVGQTLLKAGIPWRVVRTAAEIQHAETIIAFTNDSDLENVQPIVHVPQLVGWASLGRASFAAKHGFVRKFLEVLIEPLWRSYFSSRLVRKWVDRLRLFLLFTGTPFFDLPAEALQQELLGQVKTSHPSLSAAAPMLCEAWGSEDGIQYHLVNYAVKPQSVRLSFGKKVAVQIYSPDKDEAAYLEGEEIQVDLIVYSILVVKELE